MIRCSYDPELHEIIDHQENTAASMIEYKNLATG